MSTQPDADTEANSEADGGTQGKTPLLCCAQCGAPVYETYIKVGNGDFSRHLACACDSEQIDGYAFRSIDQALDNQADYNPNSEADPEALEESQ